MAQRPFYFVFDNQVKERIIEFNWFPGFSISQKQKSINSLHENIRKQNFNPLEISTKSEKELGRILSAFNLKLDGYYLENIFQSSKVFENGGPYRDLLKVTPKEAKCDERLKTSGKLISFKYNDIDFPLEPKTLFYDYIYYNAARNNLSEDDLNELRNYNAFTDIEFNNKKSLNTQARSIALVLIILNKYNKLPELDKSEFILLHKEYIK